jgi:hypothetical protein
MHVLDLGLALKGVFLPQQLICALQGHNHMVFDAVTQAACPALESLFIHCVCFTCLPRVLAQRIVLWCSFMQVS